MLLAPVPRHTATLTGIRLGRAPRPVKPWVSIDLILQRGNAGAANTQGHVAEFAAPFSVQFFELTRRAFQNYIRSPTYLMSKYAIKLLAGAPFC